MSSDSQPRLRAGEAIPYPVDLVRLGPHAGAHRVAIRLAISALLPVIVLCAMGHQDWSAYALLTATVSIYGRRRPPGVRLRIQCQVAVAQVLLIVAGAALATASVAPWVLVVCTAVIAAAAAAVADILQWNPPGALFFVFALAVCASLPDGTRSSVLIALAVSAASAATVLAVTALDSPITHPSDTNTPVPARLRNPVIAVQALACLLAALAAGLTAAAFGLDRPYWAMVSAIAPIVGATTYAQISRAGHRFVGTIAGIAPAGLLFQIRMSQTVLLVVLVALMACTEMLAARNYAGALLFLTPMTIGMALVGEGAPLPTLLIDRGAETAIGVAAAVIAILATHPVRHPPTAAGSAEHPEPAPASHPPASAVSRPPAVHGLSDPRPFRGPGAGRDPGR
ncbi:FUSC family protein [Streptomyces sp. NBC_00878]|uniref:FUSC family protein n=1 Tax=Streptomyces sp. NBC_00878 TaxID=2975854 RepID=UPI00225329FB|nr:FUSC family protein [Streptomyces sp. NBC_00878]MCX4905896.1 FUSC family protein [Streptomyces sp. NBC_00878]